MNSLLDILITIVILVVQNYLSTRRYWWFGGIVPTIYLIFAIFLRGLKYQHSHRGYLYY